MGAEPVWMHEGVINEVAAPRASEAGLSVVTAVCTLKKRRGLKKRRQRQDLT